MSYKEEKARREYYGSEEIASYFAQNIDRLCAYVTRAVELKKMVPGKHITQLTKAAGITLRIGAEEFHRLPANRYVNPSAFTNIRDLLCFNRR